MKGFFKLSIILALLGLAERASLSSVAAQSTSSVRSAIAAIQSKLVGKTSSDTPLFKPRAQVNSSKDPDDCIVSPRWEVQKVWFQDQPRTDLTPLQPSDAQNALSWQDLATYIQQFDFLKQPITDDKAAILIVDDFTTPLQYKNQPLLEDGSKVRFLTHGGLIRSQIDATLGKDFREHVGVENLEFREGEKTSALNARIEDKISALSIYYKHIVINMSFVVMSCGVVNDYKKWLSLKGDDPANPRLGMTEYINQLWAVYTNDFSVNNKPTQIFMAAVISANVIDPKIEDPLGAQTVPSGVQVRRVAAAGNFGLPYALYPAALPTVIGVAATMNGHKSPAKTFLSGNPPKSNYKLWSNAGDVAEVGQWLKVVLNGNTYYYLGTSFSTPIVSVLTAINLLGKSCRIPLAPQSGNWVTPVPQTMKDTLTGTGCKR